MWQWTKVWINLTIRDWWFWWICWRDQSTSTTSYADLREHWKVTLITCDHTITYHVVYTLTLQFMYLCVIFIIYCRCIATTIYAGELLWTYRGRWVGHCGLIETDHQEHKHIQNNSLMIPTTILVTSLCVEVIHRSFGWVKPILDR